MIGRAARRFLFMREHRWTHGHLSEYIDRELAEPERERVEAHVGLCPECHRVLATLRRTVQSLRAIGPQDPEPPAPGPGQAQSKLAEGVIDRLRKEA